MKEKNQIKLDALRMLKSKANNIAMEQNRHEANDDDMMTALSRCIKQTQEECDIYVKNERHEQAEKAKQENELYKSYLPKQLDEEEITSIVDEVIADLGASSIKDMVAKVSPSLERISPRRVSISIKY